MKNLRCYRCNQKVTTDDDIMFQGSQPVHRGDCPWKLTEKQTEYIKRLQAGDYGVPLDTPDASMWQWAKGDKSRMNSAVVHALWDKKLIEQTYTADARMLLTEAGRKLHVA
jgi:hypothetical protein